MKRAHTRSQPVRYRSRPRYHPQEQIAVEDIRIYLQSDLAGPLANRVTNLRNRRQIAPYVLVCKMLVLGPRTEHPKSLMASPSGASDSEQNGRAAVRQAVSGYIQIHSGLETRGAKPLMIVHSMGIVYDEEPSRSHV